MYTKECKWCSKIIEVEKQPMFASHIASCSLNPNIGDIRKKISDAFKGKEKSKRVVIKQCCPKCGNEFEIRILESLFKRNKYNKFCSQSCANGKIWSEEHKRLLSETNKNSEKVKQANIINLEKLRLSGNSRGLGKSKCSTNKSYTFTCLYCGEMGEEHNYRKNRKYHPSCWKKASGGIRKGSSRGKSGLYKGYWCDSSYELAYLIFCLEHSISIERNKQSFAYVYKLKQHLFFPDFRVNGKLTEIKNYRSDLTDAKLLSVTEPIDIYYKDTIQFALEYVIGKYGKNFVDLYEKF